MFLCIDTTTSASGITLAGDKTVFAPLNLRDASEMILKTIDLVIQKTDIGLQDLKGVFVIKGPGSFTGLRIGIAVANQFAHQLRIPIIGLRTDEWWGYRTDESDFIYLQTMNKAEVYILKFKTRNPAYLRSYIRSRRQAGSKPETKPKIIPIEKLSGKKLWLGQLSDEHRQKLPTGFKEITNLRSPDETWKLITKTTKIRRQKTYDLAEPYYGKEPTITKSKKKLSVK
jgi:tRNA threonylcarbamoyl adenosine modification protein YeaZ